MNFKQFFDILNIEILISKKSLITKFQIWLMQVKFHLKRTSSKSPCAKSARFELLRLMILVHWHEKAFHRSKKIWAETRVERSCTRCLKQFPSSLERFSSIINYSPETRKSQKRYVNFVQLFCIFDKLKCHFRFSRRISTLRFVLHASRRRRSRARNDRCALR